MELETAKTARQNRSETAGAFRQAAGLVHRNPALLLIPLLLDVLAVCAGWSFIGFQGEPGRSMRLILEMGLPSVSHLLNIPLPAGAVPFAAEAGTAAGLALFACFFALSCFAQGGYLSLVHRAAGGVSSAEGQSAAMAFLRGGWQGLPRFGAFAAAVLLAKSALTLLLAALFGAPGLLLALLAMFALRLSYLFLEFVIAVEGLDMVSALTPAWRAIKASPGPPLAIAAVMYVFASALSLALHAAWHPLGLSAGGVLYVYGMSILQTAFMLLYLRRREA